MKGTKVAARYAKSLLELAIERGSLEQIAGDMKYLYETQAENAELVSLFNSPIINTAKKIEVLKSVFGQFEALTMDFVVMIAEKKRENILPEIAASFNAQLKEHKGIHLVELVSAIALDESTKKTILAKVEASVNGTLEVTEKIDPRLIGGFIVNIGDRRIDASIASQFNKLKQSLTH